MIAIDIVIVIIIAVHYYYYYYFSHLFFNHLVIIFSLICTIQLIHITCCTYDANKDFHFHYSKFILLCPLSPDGYISDIRCYKGLTCHFQFLTSGTLSLRAECQCARM